MFGIGAAIGDVARTVSHRVEDIVSAPTIRLGVTGLARAGKTVFISSLVANLMARARMPQLQAEAQDRIEAAYLQPQPDDTLPRFALERHLAAMTGQDPRWPDSTSNISQLRLSLRVRPTGLLSGLTGSRTVHLDIVDYPGEWLLDLPLMAKDYAAWSAEALAQAEDPARRAAAAPFREALAATDLTGPLDEVAAQRLADAFRAYLQGCRQAGLSGVAPGRFLMPGDLAGSPALTFAPLPEGMGPLRQAFARRYDSYKKHVVTPFFRAHFARIDRQVVLVDVLGAIHAGPRAVEDLRAAMAEVLAAFRPGANAWLSSLLLGKRVERILFAATKADHVHHAQHGALSAITEALLSDARDRARFAGATTQAMAIAALRATVEQDMPHNGATLPCVRGIALDTGREAAFYPGALPEAPSALLGPAADGAAAWLAADYGVMRFAPPRLALAPGEGPPHIRLDRAAEFLIGDRL